MEKENVIKVSTGTDIVEIERIKNAIETKQDKFLKRIYTENEIAYCESKNNLKYESYAARFAAKEAIYKAINTEIDSSISWLDIEIVNNINGKPMINFVNKKYEKIESIDISLSHGKEYAIASVVVAYKD